MERRSFLAAAALAPLLSGVLVRDGGPVGQDRIDALGAVPLQQDPTIHATPEVRALLDRRGADGDLARQWLRFLQGISGRQGLTVDDVVTPDVLCIELKLAGLPGDLSTLREFRSAMNGSLADEFAILEDMTIDPSQQIVEVSLHGGGTHVGPIMGVPATGRLLAYDVRTLNHFRDGRMALRWDRTNLVSKIEELAQQLPSS